MTRIPAYIIHVQGNKKRKLFMDKKIAQHSSLGWSYINDGNIEDLDASILDTYFKGKMHNKTAFTSCAYKHILAMKSGTAKNWFLVVEDDIEFYSNFEEILENILNEISVKGIHNSIISLEDSIPKYISKSDRRANQFLYPKEEMRLAGAYLMDSEAAKNALQFITAYKSELTADWFYTHLIKIKTINCYWSQPAIACQKSIDGRFRQINFGIQKWIKKLRANFK
jgi:GR25 family glycosyltransferase involved in LPS biosynthesis